MVFVIAKPLAKLYFLESNVLALQDSREMVKPVLTSMNVKPILAIPTQFVRIHGEAFLACVTTAGWEMERLVTLEITVSKFSNNTVLAILMLIVLQPFLV